MWAEHSLHQSFAGITKSHSLCLQDDLKLQHFLWQAWNIDRDIAAAEEEHKAQEGALKVAARLDVDFKLGDASDVQVLGCILVVLAAQPSFWPYLDHNIRDSQEDNAVSLYVILWDRGCTDMWQVMLMQVSSKVKDPQLCRALRALPSATCAFPAARSCSTLSQCRPLPRRVFGQRGCWRRRSKSRQDCRRSASCWTGATRSGGQSWTARWGCCAFWVYMLQDAGCLHGQGTRSEYTEVAARPQGSSSYPEAAGAGLQSGGRGWCKWLLC